MRDSIFSKKLLQHDKIKGFRKKESDFVPTMGNYSEYSKPPKNKCPPVLVSTTLNGSSNNSWET